MNNISVTKMDMNKALGRAPRTESFVKMPRKWINRLKDAKRASAHRLAYYIQFRSWKCPNEQSSQVI
jgi:hypothetical protein